MATCFVIQGFGKKTDFTDGRVLDLDASYAVIKDAVQSAGLACIRADEIVHSGTIDVPMYRYLLDAELVIADLSTYNVNAAFELGVRYGLRDRATIIVAEEQFKNPFDVGHIVIRRYKHLGEDIGVKEAKRFRDDLKQAIDDIMGDKKPDSPVYTFLQGLTPPGVTVCVAAASSVVANDDTGTVVATEKWVATTTSSPVAPRPPSPAIALDTGTAAPNNAKILLDAALARIVNGEFTAAKVLLTEVRSIRPNDSFVIQQLALATYKSMQPTPEAALLQAKQLLNDLSPATTNDPETLGLWGAIHKRLWDLLHRAADLDESIAVCERGFSLKQDTYNGINLAHLLDMRALKSFEAGDRNNGVADAVLAKRTRNQVIRYAAPLLDKELNVEKRFWILATLREAAEGLGDQASAANWLAQAHALNAPAWMLETSESQITALHAVRTRIASFIT